MKRLIFLSMFVSYPVFASPCGGQLGKTWKNQDGSTGGFVAATSRISTQVYLSQSSEVCDLAILNGNVRIEGKSSVSEQVIISGSSIISDSRIYGFAKIEGRSFVKNSVVCQNSIIQGGKVIDSSYYCDTDDEAPKDPGEAGRKTLLGVDSDGDGVRDDIEVFINNNLSNTASKDRSEERKATKIYARILQREILLRNNEDEVLRLHSLKRELLSCSLISLRDDVFINSYDTKERLYSLFKTAGILHGQEVYSKKKSCLSLDSIDSSI